MSHEARQVPSWLIFDVGRNTMAGSPRNIIRSSIGFGTVVAFVVSWIENHSLLWAIVHAVYSWLYVAYLGLTKLGLISPIQASPLHTALAVILAFGVVAIALARIAFGSRP